VQAITMTRARNRARNFFIVLPPILF